MELPAFIFDRMKLLRSRFPHLKSQYPCSKKLTAQPNHYSASHLQQQESLQSSWSGLASHYSNYYYSMANLTSEKSLSVSWYPSSSKLKTSLHHPLITPLHHLSALLLLLTMLMVRCFECRTHYSRHLLLVSSFIQFWSGCLWGGWRLQARCWGGSWCSE